MVSSISDCLWQHGISLGPKLSEEWAHHHWHHWSVTAKQLKLARGNTENGRGKGIICKMLGNCLETTCEDRKNPNTERQDLREGMGGRGAAELLLYMQMEQLQKPLQGEKEKTQKLEEKIWMMPMWAPHSPNPTQIRKLCS